MALGDTCLYGAHSLVEEETAQAAPQIEEEQQAVAEAEAIVQQAQAPTSIHDGYYTVMVDGDHKYRTFRLRTQGETEILCTWLPDYWFPRRLPQ